MAVSTTKLYTIGYGGRGPQEFVELLRAHEIRTVVDVRARPQNAYMGCYAKAKSPEKGIERLLGEAEIAYLSLPELGNPFTGDDWRERFGELLEREGEEMIRRLGEAEPPLCLLCAEKRASNCHRTLIASYLAKTKGWAVEHIE
jgi:uncharacterized protein (DUF488 family)